MDALKAALRNKEKPVLPFAVLGLLSLVSVANVLKNWGESRLEGTDTTALEVVGAVAFFLYWIGRAWKYSQSFFRTPISVLLAVSVFYDAWLYWSHSIAVYGMTSFAVEAGWVCAIAVLYFDTNIAPTIHADWQ